MMGSPFDLSGQSPLRMNESSRAVGGDASDVLLRW